MGHCIHKRIPAPAGFLLGFGGFLILGQTHPMKVLCFTSLCAFLGHEVESRRLEIIAKDANCWCSLVEVKPNVNVLVGFGESRFLGVFDLVHVSVSFGC